MTTPISELLPVYFQSNLRIRKEETRDQYRKALRRFEEYLGHPPTLGDLTDDNLTGFILWTLETEKLVEVTANHRAKTIRAFWEWAARRRLVEQFPTFRKVREPELIPRAWLPEELAALFAACARQTGYIGRCKADEWWLALHHFLLDTGERTEAALALRWDWVDLKHHTVSVPAQVRKGGLKAMVYRISARTAAAFEAIRQPERELVFEKQFGNSAFYHRYTKLVKGAGLPTPRGRCGPKKMRITVFTMIEVGGGDASKFARHSCRKVTDDSYIDRALTTALSKNKWPPEALPFNVGGLLSRLLAKLRAAVV